MDVVPGDLEAGTGDFVCNSLMGLLFEGLTGVRNVGVGLGRFSNGGVCIVELDSCALVERLKWLNFNDMQIVFIVYWIR